MAEVCVIGAGPAGAVFAARLAHLGYQVHLVERARFPRRHVGESLSPGVMPLLASAQMQDIIERAAFSRVSGVWVKWAEELTLRQDEREQGILVDRGEFDLGLLNRVRDFGVRVYQPARILEQFWDGARWRVRIDADGNQTDLSVALLADASGRRQTRQRALVGPLTLAVYGYWRGKSLPTMPRIEAGRDAWYWGVPLPDGTYNTLVFIDPQQLRCVAGATLNERFLRLVEASNLMENCSDAELVVPPHAIDATAYLSNDPVTRNRIEIGDAAVAIDPISSSGVQKAIQTALSGAVVANTLLRRPEWAEAAISFYRGQLADSFDRHRQWAGQHYRAVADRNDHSFWSKRAISIPGPDLIWAPTVDPRTSTTAPLALSCDLKFVQTPCLRGDFVSVADALHHPRLASPLVFLGGRELAPLLQGLSPSLTLVQIAQSWSRRMPFASGMAIAGWLVSHGILVEQNGGEAAP
jgi:flavin-dependent dehydrogenase